MTYWRAVLTDSFLREGKSNYVSVLAASLVLVAVNFVLGFVAFFVAIFGGFAILSDTGGCIGIVGLAIIRPKLIQANKTPNKPRGLFRLY